MGRYASDNRAYGISDRSGFRYRLKDMRREWNGLLVGKDEYEEKHPQLEPRRVRADAQALRDPRPDTREGLTVYVDTRTVETYDAVIIRAVAKIGTVTVSTS